MVLPFSPEVGSVTQLSTGELVVGATEPGKSDLRAVALVTSPGGLARKVDLGSVHGDVLPPRVAVRPGGGPAIVVAAVPTGAPRGTLLRTCRIDGLDDPSGAPRVTWGKELATTADESDAFSLEAGAAHSVLAWDDWNKDHGHSTVVTVALRGHDPAAVSEPRVVSSDGEDAEGPVVVARPEGFFIAWITGARAAVSGAPGARALRAAGGGTSAPPAPSAAVAPGAEGTPAVELGRRFITLRRLDAEGAPVGLPLAVTPRDGQVMDFDLVALPDGSALLAYRNDRSAPGTAGGALFTVVVRAGGSIEPHRIDAEDLGAAAPQLFVAPGGGGGTSSPSAWLSIAGEGDATLLAPLDGEGREAGRLQAEPALDGAMLLSMRGSVHGATALLARPRGRGLELTSARCARDLPVAPAPSASASAR